MPRPLLIDASNLPDQAWFDPAKGQYRYRQMLSSNLGDSRDLAAGIMTFSAGDHWAVHRHAEAEIYLGLEGEADIEVDGSLYRLRPRALLYIPGDTFHGVPSTPGPLHFFYAFAADEIETIRYTFRDAF